MKQLINIFIILFTVNCFALTDVESSKFRDVSVKITNEKMNSGGTGSILSSSSKGSVILTNKHVCAVVEEGGRVVTPSNNYKVDAYKKFTAHDLCLVRVRENLHQSLEVAAFSPQAPQKSFVTGHPRLMPNIITEGHFSDELVVRILIGIRDCTAKERKADPFVCDFLGFPSTQDYHSQMVSNLIQPGKSGSAVLNADGELSGVVFAGRGELGFGIIVPHIHVIMFLATQNWYSWKTPNKKKPATNKETKMEKAIRECKQTKDYPSISVANICHLIQTDMVFRGE